MPKSLTLIPKISEKALGRTTDKVYVFMVPIDSSKERIARAVEAQFDVTVKKVRLMVVKGKSKNSMRKRLQPLEGKRADAKKAYVTLSKGNIPMLEES